MSMRSIMRTVICLVLVAGLVMSAVSCTGTPSSATPTAGIAVPPTEPTMAPDAAATPSTASTPTGATPAASLDGEWEGPIKVAGQELGTIIKFETSDGVLKGWLDIPAQQVKQFVLEKVSLQGSTLHFEAFGGARNAVWEGEIQADGTIAGTFKQASYEGTFTLKRKAAASASPAVEKPYNEEEVTFKNGDVTLGGTLSTPHMGGPFPVVVLISGSGQQNRDEEVYGFKPFALIADHLTRNGIAVLRYDDRGIGASTGDFNNATSVDFAGDVQAAVDMLKTLPYINSKQIGLMGHSEGGLIAPMVATTSSDIAFMVLLAGPGVRGDVLLERQVVDVMKAEGKPQAEVDKAMADQQRMLEAIKTGQGVDAILSDLREAMRLEFEKMPEDQRAALGDVDKAIEDAVQAQVSVLMNPWVKFFVAHDPAPVLEKVEVPVLALFGGKDVQVAAEPNAEAMKAAFAASKNSRATVKTYPTANHLFQPATTGGVSEYATLKDFVPGFLDETTTWIKDVLKSQ